MLFHPRRKHPARRALRRNINLLIISELFAELRFYFPVAVLVFQSITGSYAAAMSVFALANIMHAFFEIPTGLLSDRWGRRGTLIAGAIGEFLSAVCYAAAFSSPTPYLWLYGGSVFYGFSNALFSGNNQAMIFETLGRYRKSKETAKILGRISGMGQIGIGVASTFATLALWAGLTYTTLLYLTLVSLSVNILLAFLTIEPPDLFVKEDNTWKHCKKALRLIVKNKKLRLYALASMIGFGGGQAHYYFTPGFVDSVWPTWMTPLYRIGQHAIGACSFWIAGPIIKRFSAINILAAGTGFSYTLMLIATGITNFFSPLLLMTTQASYALTKTADLTVQQENFSNEQRATMGSLISLGTAGVTAVAAVLTGWISDVTTPAFAMGFMIVARALIVQSTYWRIYRKHR